MHTIYYLSRKDKKLRTLQKPRSGSWIHINAPTEEDIQLILKLTKLSDTDINDALDLYEIPRIEHHGDCVVLFVRNPTASDDAFHTQLLTVIVNDKYFITISPSENIVVEDFLKTHEDINTTQRSKLLLRLLLAIADSYTHNIKNIRNRIEIKKLRTMEISDNEIISLTRDEQVLNQYLISLVPMKNVFEAILTGKYITLYEEDSDLVEDMLNSIRQFVDICTVNLKGIQSIRNAYQILFTNKLNNTMKLLTSFTIILTIPTIIASIYGMNVHLPLERHPYAFLIILLVTGLFSSASLVIFRKLKWL